MDTLGTMPTLAAPSHLYVCHGIIVFTGTQGVEFVPRSEQPLHHDGVGGGGVCVVLAKELHQTWQHLTQGYFEIRVWLLT